MEFSCGRSASPPNSGSESLGTVLLILGVLGLNVDRGAVNACAALDFNQLPAAVVALGGGKVGAVWVGGAMMLGSGCPPDFDNNFMWRRIFHGGDSTYLKKVENLFYGALALLKRVF
jgi:hypothetical protein